MICYCSLETKNRRNKNKLMQKIELNEKKKRCFFQSNIVFNFVVNISPLLYLYLFVFKLHYLNQRGDVREEYIELRNKRDMGLYSLGCNQR